MNTQLCFFFLWVGINSKGKGKDLELSQLYGGTHGMMVNFIVNEHGDSNSNPQLRPHFKLW